MISLLRRIIWAFARPKPRLRWQRAHFKSVMSELHRRGKAQHESGAFLLGERYGETAIVREVVYYDDLDPRAYDQGICILHGASFGKLWGLCRERRLEVVGDVHTHGGGAGQSESDRTNPMVAQPGHWALIIPCFAQAPVRPEDLGIYEYIGNHAWHSRGGMRWRSFLSFKGA
jgi:proteasome lid subunit RPN8/RPN11